MLTGMRLAIAHGALSAYGMAALGHGRASRRAAPLPLVSPPPSISPPLLHRTRSRATQPAALGQGRRWHAGKGRNADEHSRDAGMVTLARCNTRRRNDRVRVRTASRSCAPAVAG